MNVVRFELIELPYPTLARFGLTQEMIEDLPMRVLDEICDGRHSPVLPVRVRDEKGELIESRSRFALVRRDDGLSDVVFYPVLESSPLERYDEAQQKQLLAGKAILADVETADGRHSKAFVQIDEETKQVMYIPTPIIGRNLQVLADIMHLGTMEVNSMQNGEPLTLVVGNHLLPANPTGHVNNIRTYTMGVLAVAQMGRCMGEVAYKVSDSTFLWCNALLRRLLCATVIRHCTVHTGRKPDGNHSKRTDNGGLLAKQLLLRRLLDGGKYRGTEMPKPRAGLGSMDDT